MLISFLEISKRYLLKLWFSTDDAISDAATELDFVASTLERRGYKPVRGAEHQLVKQV